MEWLLLIKSRVLVVQMDIKHVHVGWLLIWNAWYWLCCVLVWLWLFSGVTRGEPLQFLPKRVTLA